jgi:hypothetical protein
MPVHVVADSASKLSNLRATLEPKYAVTSELIGGAKERSSDTDAIVVTADLRVIENITALREMLGGLPRPESAYFWSTRKHGC